jgi:DHA1 family bicyclomycin/chloramphenicol resistance-like MFS transporter
MVSPVGMVFPTAMSLALSGYPHQAGAASSLVGLGQYLVGAVAAPLVGIAGEQNAQPLGIVCLVASVGAVLVFTTQVVPALRRTDADVTGSPG